MSWGYPAAIWFVAVAIPAIAMFLYAEVDLETKRAAIAKAGPVGTIEPTLVQWRSDASILDWLEAL